MRCLLMGGLMGRGLDNPLRQLFAAIPNVWGCMCVV